MEKWKRVSGYEGLYEVSSQGRIKSFHRDKVNGKIMRQATEKLSHTNYKSLTLVDNTGNKKQYRVHRIVAEAFIKNTKDKRFVNHKDNNGENNNVANLEWCTQSENIQHSHNQGRQNDNVDKANKIQSEKAKKNREAMVGKTYGKWTVLKALPREYKGKTVSKMLCRCECGTEKEVDMISLKNGRSTKCTGCATRETLRRRYENSKQS